MRAGLNCRRISERKPKQRHDFRRLCRLHPCVHASRRLLTWAVTSASGTSKDYRSFRRNRYVRLRLEKRSTPNRRDAFEDTGKNWIKERCIVIIGERGFARVHRGKW